MELSKREISAVAEAIDFYLASMTSDGDMESAIAEGFGAEVALMRRISNLKR
jgi:NMD protein affecting ribosome stability and mRNA decay